MMQNANMARKDQDALSKVSSKKIYYSNKTLFHGTLAFAPAGVGVHEQ